MDLEQIDSVLEALEQTDGLASAALRLEELGWVERFGLHWRNEFGIQLGVAAALKFDLLGLDVASELGLRIAPLPIRFAELQTDNAALVIKLPFGVGTDLTPWVIRDEADDPAREEVLRETWIKLQDAGYELPYARHRENLFVQGANVYCLFWRGLKKVF